MKYTYFLIIILFFSFRSGAQVNLVPNPSFELYDTCPINQGQIAYATGWNNFGDSPDYFNSCSFNPDFSVPNNWGGYQNAAHGNAYCGIGTFLPSFPNVRENIGAQLTSPLVIGTTYYVSFKISLSISHPIQSYIATNNLGCLFSTSGYSWQFPPPLINYAQVYTGSIVTDSTNWTTVFGSFIADSSYSFIMLGNFFDDANTDTIVFVDSTLSCSYYFVDEVCVSTDSLYSLNYVTGIEEAPLERFAMIYPNPAQSHFIIDVTSDHEFYTVEVIDAQGKLIFKLIDLSGQTNIDLSSYPAGLYSIIVTAPKNSILYKLLKL